MIADFNRSVLEIPHIEFFFLFFLGIVQNKLCAFLPVILAGRKPALLLQCGIKRQTISTIYVSHLIKGRYSLLDLPFQVEYESLSFRLENRHRHLIWFLFHEEKCTTLKGDSNQKPAAWQSNALYPLGYHVDN